MRALLCVLFLLVNHAAVAKVHDFTSPCKGVELTPSSILEILEHAKVHRFYAASFTSLTDARALFHQNVYTSCFTNEMSITELPHLSELDLELVFHALYEIAFYTKDKQVIQDVSKVVRLKARYKEELTVYVQRLFGLHVAARSFELAKQLKQQYPNIELPALPNVVLKDSLSKPSVFKLSKDGNTLSEVEAEVPEVGAHIVIVSSSSSSSANKFKSWLMHNTKVKSAVEQHSTWLIPQTTQLELGLTQASNLMMPSMQLLYVKDQKAWPDIHYWGAPAFYFYRDGELISHMKGWSGERDKSELQRHLMSIGLLSG